MHSKPLLKVDWATHKAADFACKNWHYSGGLPYGKSVKIGAWEDNKFIGVVVFGRGANKSLGGPFGLKQDESMELVRVALTTHKTEVSRIVSIAIKLLKSINSKAQLIVSYADPAQGHIGGIYQAGNWLYKGETAPKNDYFFKGRWCHRRTVGAAGYSLTGMVGRYSPGKHIYFYPLNKAIKKRLLTMAKPYPKITARRLEEEQQIPSADDGATPISTLQSSSIS